MKYSIIIVVVYLFASCKSSSIKTTINEKEYMVLSIDSINSVYVIRAKSEKKYYKILSVKTTKKNSKCDKIQVGKTYNFKLNPGFLSDPIFPINVDGYMFNNEIITIEKDSIYDIHEAKNLKGLCFKK
ncbi:hypothetical protein [Flavobacterium sp. '19STA2R22 D10 B1']|uniref:hypothetical protein n=1 Tax=Flavobacterium aerium TaxID=3037261 RepID=UPI00278C3EC6|nr:hypothetical protein [Flavobacterium sp. '19STA2R22 D10 B1']